MKEARRGKQRSLTSHITRVLKIIPMQRLAVSMYKRTIIPSHMGIKKDTRAVKEAIGLMMVSPPYSRVLKIIPML